MAMPTIAEMEAFIRSRASQLGIDPEIAVKVAKSEGLQPGTWQSNSKLKYGREQSYGPFQLHVAPEGHEPGMGNDFMAQTGLNPSDPSTWKQGVDFALGKAKEGGWGPWFGAKKLGITGMLGIGDNPAELPALQAENPTLAGVPSVAQRSQPSASNGIMPAIMNKLGMSASISPSSGGGIMEALMGMLSATGSQQAAPPPAPMPQIMNPSYNPTVDTKMDYNYSKDNEEEKLKKLLASLGM